MAPRKASKMQVEQLVTGEDTDSEQGALDPKAINKDMEKNTHLRQTKKRKELSAKYQDEMASLNDQILSITKTATKLLAGIRQDQQQRLHELVCRRAAVEDQIVRHSQVLEKAYEEANRELNAAAQGRLEDLQTDNQDDEDPGPQSTGADRRQLPSHEAIKKAEDMARKGRRV